MRALVLLAAVVSCCPNPHTATPPRADLDARVEIARLEARRGAGVDELIARAGSTDPATADLALRALGRVGGPRALDALIARTSDPSAVIAGRAAAAIGVLAATSDPSPAVIAKTSAALVAALDHPGIDVAVVVEALGRAGDATTMAALAARVADTDPAIAAAAGDALLRFSRREFALDAPTHAALIAALAGAGGSDVHHAAALALAREFHAKPPEAAAGAAAPVKPATLPAPTADDRAVIAALVTAIGDPDPETRAVAIDGLRRHKAVADGASQIEQALRDDDWRVAVQAARALGGADGTDSGKDAVAAALVRTWAMIVAGTTAPARAHVLLEGLRAIAPSAARPAVHDALVALQTASTGATASTVTPLIRGWTHCLATAALERTDPSKFDGGARVMACGGDAIAPHLRAELVGDLIEAEVGTSAQRKAAIGTMVASDDPRVRAAGLAAIATAWAKLDPADRDGLAAAVVAGLAGTAPVEVGTAAETVRTLLALTDPPAAVLSADARSTLSVALIDRAARETDPEIGSGLLDTLAQAKLPDGKAACERGAQAVSPVIRAAAGRCLTALAAPPAADGAPADAATHDRPLDEPAAADLPADDAAAVIGKTVTWKVTTTRGTITIALAPDVAPWTVAAIAALTKRGFYDGLVFHRVVPDFVVQGGDPTGTGWGGPGFTLPAEPGTRLDGDDYRAGAIGIADAGKDSGSSQWFAMHSHAPYLEGRYTRIGKVTAGQEVVDALVVGDAIVRATVTVE